VDAQRRRGSRATPSRGFPSLDKDWAAAPAPRSDRHGGDIVRQVALALGIAARGAAGLPVAFLSAKMDEDA